MSEGFDHSAEVSNEAVAPTSTSRVLAGLVVLWLTITLVFLAHRYSQTLIETSSATTTDLLRDNAGLRHSLAPEIKFILPIRLSMRGVTPLEAMSALGKYVGFTFEEEQMAATLEHQARNYRFEDLPLYQVLHRIVGDRSKGLALSGVILFLFDQQVRATPNSFHWKARLPLAFEPTLIAPTEEREAWFSLTLEPKRDSADPPQIIIVEVWQGGGWLVKGRLKLDKDERGQLLMSSNQEIRLAIARTQETDVERNNLYSVEIFMQE